MHSLYVWQQHQCECKSECKGEEPPLCTVCVQEFTFHRVSKRPGHCQMQKGSVEIGLVKVETSNIAWLKKKSPLGLPIELHLKSHWCYPKSVPFLSVPFSVPLFSVPASSLGEMTSQCLLTVILIGSHFYLRTVIFALQEADLGMWKIAAI